VSALPSPRLRSAVFACAVLLLSALGLRRPELVAMAAPLGLLLILGISRTSAPELTARAELSDLRAVETDEVELTLTLESPLRIAQLDLRTLLPPGMEPLDDRPLSRMAVEADVPFVVRRRYRCSRWGGYVLGVENAVVRDRAGLFAYTPSLPARLPLRVYPAADRIRARPSPRRTQLSVGSDVARTKGDGIERAEVRPFVPGDRVRSMNWRTTARRGSPYVNEHHPERNADVVLFIDSFGDDQGWGPDPLDQVVHGAAAIAHAYLERRDRVGVVGFGGVLRWVLPAAGRVQEHRIIDSLIDTRIVASVAWRDVDVIPSRTLPPRALVLALTPLIDTRTVAALANLRARGFDLAVIEIAPEPHLPPPDDDIDRLARRFWALRREQVRAHYAAVGVQVVEWRREQPVEAVLAHLREARRWSRVASR
jgi:uncharacterized protein (DUF58 family)